MKHASIGILVLALVAALALPAAAQNQTTQAGQSSPGSSPASEQPSSSGSSQISGQQPGADQSRVGADTSDQNRATTTATQSDSSMRTDQSRHNAKMNPSVTLMLKGGEEADRMQFQALDEHLQMLENSINQLRQLSNQPEQNAADILRWSDIRDQHAHGVADVVASYFLEQRLLPPSMPELGLSTASSSERAREQAGIAGSSTTSSTSPEATTSTTAGASTSETARMSQNDPMRQAYLDQLQTAHELLVRAHMVTQSNDPADVREIRSLVGKLRSNQQTYQHQIEAHMRDVTTPGANTEQASRSGQQANEPGIDQPGERQAARPGESGSSSVSPNSSDSSGNQAGSPGAAGSSGGQGGASGSTTP